MVCLSIIKDQFVFSLRDINHQSVTKLRVGVFDNCIYRVSYFNY